MAKMLKQSMLNLSDDYLHVVSLQLTFARINALRPPVINVSIASTSTVLKPSTARSATTVPARFLEHAAFGACYWFYCCGGDGWRAGDWRPGY